MIKNVSMSHWSQYARGALFQWTVKVNAQNSLGSLNSWSSSIQMVLKPTLGLLRFSLFFYAVVLGMMTWSFADFQHGIEGFCHHLQPQLGPHAPVARGGGLRQRWPCGAGWARPGKWSDGGTLAAWGYGGRTAGGFQHKNAGMMGIQCEGNWTVFLYGMCPTHVLDPLVLWRVPKCPKLLGPQKSVWGMQMWNRINGCNLSTGKHRRCLLRVFSWIWSGWWNVNMAMAAQTPKIGWLDGTSAPFKNPFAITSAPSKGRRKPLALQEAQW